MLGVVNAEELGQIVLPLIGGVAMTQILELEKEERRKRNPCIDSLNK